MSLNTKDDNPTKNCGTYKSPTSSSRLKNSRLENRAGKILKMHLKNFMCHSNLVIEFNSRVNILVGNNGSGKSAILSALIIGLGKSANIASRSSNIKQLIRRGCSSATIEIHLNNSGLERFEQEIYGNVIIIVRHMTIHGASSYKIMNERGELITNEFCKLQRILSFMNIQVENPLCVLNQEASRTFIKDADSKKRFQLFRKGTLIECIVDDLNECTRLYNHASIKAEHIKMKKTKILQEYDEIAAKYKSLLTADSLRDNIKELEHELIWSEIIQLEQNMNKLVKEIDEKKQSLIKLEDKINNREQISQNLKTNIKSVNSSIIAENDKYLEAIRNYETERKSFLKISGTYSEQKRVYTKTKEKIEHLKRNIIQLQNDISKQANSNEQHSVERKRNEQFLKTTEREKEDNELVLQTARRDIQDMNSTLEVKQQSVDSLQENLKICKNKISRITTDLCNMNKEKTNNLILYGNQMPQFLAAIEAAHKSGLFSELPRGPLGRYVEVVDSKWQRLVENILGGLLQSFCVSTTNDSKVLSRIMQKFPEIPKFTTIVSKFVNRMHDVRNGMVNQKENTVSLLNSIKVSDPIVMNILIDQAKIENILLTEKSVYAQYYTSDKNNVPRNLSKMYVLNPYAEYCPAPNYRSYGMKLGPSRFLQRNILQLKRQLEDESTELQSQIDEINRNLNSKNTEFRILKKQIIEKKQNLERIELQNYKLMKKIIEIKNIEYPADNEYQILNKELAELQISLATNESHICNLQEDYEKTALEKKTSEARTIHLKEISLENEAKIENYKRILADTNNELQLIITTSSQSESELKETKLQLKKIQNDQMLATKKKNDLLLSGGERLTTERLQDVIKDEIKNVLSQIRVICAGNDNIDEIKNIMNEKQSMIEHSEETINKINDAFKACNVSKISKFNWVKRFQQHMSLRIKQKFNKVMSIRKCIGEIKINFVTNKLDLTVIPQQQPVENAVSNTKSLSGGERSFSTLGFLLALWSCVNNPFSCLDEYDVFTDQMNQQIMSSLLINESERHSNKQFIFLTPLNVSFIKETKNITFHKLDDPV